MIYTLPPLVFGRNRRHIGVMSKKPRVTFQPKRIAEGDWQIEARQEGEEPRYITGLTSHEDARQWIDGPRKLAWLRSQGLAK